MQRRAIAVFLAVLVMTASAGCGSSTSGGSGHTGPSAGPVYEYTLASTPKIPGEGREVVWYDPSTGESRDIQGLGLGVRQLEIVGSDGASQTNWAPQKATETTVYRGSRQFVGRMVPVSAGWMLDDYLAHHPGKDRLTVSTAGGRLRLVSRDGRGALTLTVVGKISALEAEQRGLFALHLEHVTDVFRQIVTGHAPVVHGVSYWLGRSWAGHPANGAYLQTPVPRHGTRGVTYGVSYGDQRVMVQSSHTTANGIGLLGKIFTRPVACRFADGEPAHVVEARHLDHAGLSARDRRAAGRARIIVAYSAEASVTLTGQRSDLPGLRLVCAGIRPV